MIKHPKFELFFKIGLWPYTIMEHVVSDGGMMSRQYGQYITFEKAINALSQLSTGPILLASSAQPADNTFDMGTY